MFSAFDPSYYVTGATQQEHSERGGQSPRHVSFFSHRLSFLHKINVMCVLIIAEIGCVHCSIPNNQEFKTEVEGSLNSFLLNVVALVSKKVQIFYLVYG